MAKIIMFNMITLDGFFEGPNHDIDWHTVDDEFNEFAIDQLKTAEGLIFGRVTYELMESYWPTRAAAQDDPVVAGLMNNLPKIVFSNTLDHARWTNTRLAKGEAAEEVARLRQQHGKDWLILGSANLAFTLTRHGLIDEYRLMVNPVVIGGGDPLFQDNHDRLHFTLVKSRAFQNGNILLCYQPVRD